MDVVEHKRAIWVATGQTLLQGSARPGDEAEFDWVEVKGCEGANSLAVHGDVLYIGATRGVQAVVQEESPNCLPMEFMNQDSPTALLSAMGALWFTTEKQLFRWAGSGSPKVVLQFTERDQEILVASLAEAWGRVYACSESQLYEFDSEGNRSLAAGGRPSTYFIDQSFRCDRIAVRNGAPFVLTRSRQMTVLPGPAYRLVGSQLVPLAQYYPTWDLDVADQHTLLATLSGLLRLTRQPPLSERWRELHLVRSIGEQRVLMAGVTGLTVASLSGGTEVDQWRLVPAGEEIRLGKFRQIDGRLWLWGEGGLWLVDPKRSLVSEPSGLHVGGWRVVVRKLGISRAGYRLETASKILEKDGVEAAILFQGERKFAEDECYSGSGAAATDHPKFLPWRNLKKALPSWDSTVYLCMRDESGSRGLDGPFRVFRPPMGFLSGLVRLGIALLLLVGSAGLLRTRWGRRIVDWLVAKREHGSSGWLLRRRLLWVQYLHPYLRQFKGRCRAVGGPASTELFTVWGDAEPLWQRLAEANAVVQVGTDAVELAQVAGEIERLAGRDVVRTFSKLGRLPLRLELDEERCGEIAEAEPEELTTQVESLTEQLAGALAVASGIEKSSARWLLNRGRFLILLSLSGSQGGESEKFDDLGGRLLEVLQGDLALAWIVSRDHPWNLAAARLDAKALAVRFSITSA